MSSLQALGVCIGISVAMGGILVTAISKPLGCLIGRVCPQPEGVGFWLRFTVIMLFLSPLFVTVAFGLPPASALKALEPGELIQRAVTSSLVGAFLAMMGIGTWVSTMTRRVAPAPMPRSAGPNEFWGDKSSDNT